VREWLQIEATTAETKTKNQNEKMNQAERITNLFAYDFNGNPGGVITKNNCYTFDQYEPSHTAWLRHEDNVRGSLKIARDAKHGGSNATFSPAHFAA
jgi:hypothetical protein